MNRNEIGAMALSLMTTALVVFCAPLVAEASFLLENDATTAGGLTPQDVTGNPADIWGWSPYTFGNRFTVGAKDIVVTKLGYADLNYQDYTQSGDGLADSHDMGIWNDSGTLLASLTVPSGTSAALTNGFRYAELTNSLTLEANHTYILGGNTTGSENHDLYKLGGSFTTGTGVTILGRQQIAGSSLACPNESLLGGDVWGSVNMQYSTIPEPSMLVLVITGLWGLVAYAWQKRKS